MRERPDFLLERVLHRDGMMIVLDKPAGLVVHANPRRGAPPAESLEDYFEALKFGLPRAPALAHRLDRDTTGCLILGRHRKALARLGKLFQQNRVEKTYWAVCRGAPSAAKGTVDAPLRKRNDVSGWRMIVAADGQKAITDYAVVAERGDLAFIEASPKTGRTHQIRVHLAAIGAPILGDPLYGDLSQEDRARPMMLHARKVVVPISKTGAPVAVEAQPPPAMAELLAHFESP